MSVKLRYMKPGLRPLTPSRKLACVSGSSASGSGWTCNTGNSPGTTGAYCYSNGDGAVSKTPGACSKVGNNAVGTSNTFYTACEKGNNPRNTPNGNACNVGNVAVT